MPLFSPCSPHDKNFNIQYETQYYIQCICYTKKVCNLLSTSLYFLHYKISYDLVVMVESLDFCARILNSKVWICLSYLSLTLSLAVRKMCDYEVY
jgi:hypothetical protein